MEHVVRCRVQRCGWAESWDTEAAAHAAANWHVYDEHPDLWAHIIGASRPPGHGRPEEYGQKFEDWERQWA